ncbi:mismatch-specific DNA-glycosylase [Nocardioides massiliensis]|uniref:TDG/mug DNA glycosylase family protein n=1 Tax=Nocardioides massiliensis TaxID=1325935 RepID=A0ABT9NKW5_9ACTN|nr:mismatch-specific DNA-glycosylase [Nocardioides massiliensis]MDP9821053.1 TDG/mug DNA glycosylase family protein [Nocardioides massiliensis]
MLPDLLRPGLAVVFCGTAVATASAARGHYYSGPGNKFWQLLHEAGFTPILLCPEDDASLLDHGVGLTDLVKGVAQSHDAGLDYSGTSSVAAHIVAASPAWVAFNGLTAGRAAATQLGLARKKEVALGEQPWGIGASRVFVLPSSSGANAGMPYTEKLKWWRELYERASTDS